MKLKRALLTIISAVLSLLLLTQCSNRREDDETLGSLYPDFQSAVTFPAPPGPPVPLTGVWEHNFPFYSSELILNEDGTFKFYDQGCTGQSYTEGDWTENGRDIWLNSYERYNTHEEEIINTPEIPAKEDSYEEPQFSDDTLADNDTIVNEWGPLVVHINLEETIYAPLSGSMTIGWPDTFYTYFKDVHLIFQSDTLYWVYDKSVATTKFWKAKS